MSDLEHDDKSYDEIRQERKALMDKKFPRNMFIDIRSEKHFTRFKLKAMSVFGQSNFKKTWYFENVTGKDLNKLYYNVSQGELLDPLAEADIKPMVIFGVTDDVSQEQYDSFIREMKKMLFKTQVVEVHDKLM
jgi:hypothetical protein